MTLLEKQWQLLNILHRLKVNQLNINSKVDRWRGNVEVE